MNQNSLHHAAAYASRAQEGNSSPDTGEGARIAQRRRLAAIREEARRLFECGAPAMHVARFLSKTIDAFLLDLFDAVQAGFGGRQRSALSSNAAVIAIGGSGRGELAPCSDTDLLFLHRGSAGDEFAEFAARSVRDCWDAGLQLGHSVRTLGETIGLARQEPEVATSLVEARLLWGCPELFETFQRTIRRKVIRQRMRTFVKGCLAARVQEESQFGFAVNQLEPDVKRSAGGLRDLHLIRWIGFARYGTADFAALHRLGALSADDVSRLAAAQEFLMGVRAELHFQAGRCQDVLTREEQLRLAERRAVRAPAGQRPVERFMQTYFRHCSAVAEISQQFADRHRPRSLLSRAGRSLVSRRVDDLFTIAGGHVDILPRYRERVFGSLENTLRLYRVAASHDAVPTPELTDAVRRAVPRLRETVPAGPRSPTIGGTGETAVQHSRGGRAPGAAPRFAIPSKAAELFRRILSEPANLGRTVRCLHDAGLLDVLVPELEHARGLIQFNQYHSYTVDEHCLRAVEAAADFARDDGPLGRAYRDVHHKDLLHLALLLHDLGKGFDEDHSEVGGRIARRTAERLGLPEPHCETLVFLVHKHLLMTHLAFRRDIADLEVLLPFSHEIGSPETLRMLYVLSAADLCAVGPGVWTNWKAELLTELYERTMLILGGEANRFDTELRRRQIRDAVQASIVPLEPSEPDGPGANVGEWIDQQLQALSPHYLGATPPAQIAADLDLVRQLGPGGTAVHGREDPETATVEYRVIADGDRSDGCFYKAAGVLAAKRLEILSAQINTTPDGVVLDRFRVVDNDFAGTVPASRIDDVCETIRRALNGDLDVEDLLQRSARFEARADAAPISNLPTRVVLDNDSSDRCTIIEIFTHDRPGLLYAISRALNRMRLSVKLAKISTHLDQVVDVFYVTEEQGRKIEDPNRLRGVKGDLNTLLEDFERTKSGRSIP